MHPRLGRIGSHGKSIHIISEYDHKTGWGTSLCAHWAGLVTPADDGHFCRECSMNSPLNTLRRLSASCKVCSTCAIGRSRCNEGHRDLDPHVFSTMSPSPFMICGQNPGVNECIKGVPFVGDAGIIFDNALKLHGLHRGVFYITNAVKCFTPGNRKPTTDEVNNCSSYLASEIKTLNPTFIITLGAVAFDIMCADKVYGECLGDFVKSGKYGKMVFPIYHPSPRNLSDKHRLSKFNQDIKVMCELVRRVSGQIGFKI